MHYQRKIIFAYLTDSYFCSSTWPVQKVSNVIFFFAETNEAREVRCGRKVESTYLRIRGFFPAVRQRQSRAASV